MRMFLLIMYDPKVAYQKIRIRAEWVNRRFKMVKDGV